MLFTFFAEATMGAVRSVVDNEALVRKIQFPRLAIPLSVVLLALFNLCLNLIVVTIFALIAGVRPMLTWLEVPLIIGAAGGAVHRDRDAAVGAVRLLPGHPADLGGLNQVIFYASPIIIPIAVVQQHLSPALLHLYMLNPLAVIFQQFRHAFINHATPSAATCSARRRRSLEPIGDRARRSSSSASGCSIGSRRAWPRTSRTRSARRAIAYRNALERIDRGSAQS